MPEEKEKEKKPVPDYRYGKYSNYQRIQTNRYNKENYKTITVRFRDNGDYCARDDVRAAAELAGMSTNEFCLQALLKEAQRVFDKQKNKS